MNFTELGKYLDNLKLDQKIDQVFKVLEDLAFPSIEVIGEKTLRQIEWKECIRNVKFICVQLTKENITEVERWLADEDFSHVEKKDFGIETEYGNIEWLEWIVIEGSGLITFYSDEEFKKSYTVVKSLNDEM